MKNLVLISFSFLLIQCVSKKPSEQAYTDIGLWVGKVQMTNQTTKQRKWVNVTWASDSSAEKMRIDVTAILDIPVATYIKNTEGFHLWVFTERKYYFSQDGKSLFKFLTKLSVDPNIFYSMLGQPKHPGVGWQCDKSEKAELSCKSEDSTQFIVKYSEANKRMIHINKGAKALRIRLSRSKVQLQDKLFNTLSTSQFKTFKL